MLRAVVTEKAYQTYVEANNHELEQIEAQFTELQKQRVTLDELTEQVKPKRLIWPERGNAAA